MLSQSLALEVLCSLLSMVKSDWDGLGLILRLIRAQLPVGLGASLVVGVQVSLHQFYFIVWLYILSFTAS